MFGWCDEDGGSKIFWFEETKAGYQKLVRPDGSSRICKENNKYFEEWGSQSLAGWRRARLLMKEYEYWDVTAFGCGAFCNPPDIVAEAFAKNTEKYRDCFDMIEYAVYHTAREKENFEVFDRVMKRFQ